MLEVVAISAGYGKVKILNEVTLTVPEGQIVSLVGANSAGKTTLANIISGFVNPWSGTVLFNKEQIDEQEPHEIVQAGLAQVPEGRQLFPDMTVEENLIVAATTPRSKPERAKTLSWIYDLFPILEERRLQPSNSLSGGEQQMLAIGRALMTRPSFLICDEPSLGLAPKIVSNLFALFKTLNKEKGLTLLLIEQNIRVSLAISNWGYVLENGQVVLEDTGKVLLSHPHVKRAYLGI